MGKKKKLEDFVEEVQVEEKKSRKTDSSLKNDKTATFAIFAEPAVATKAYDPRMVEGLTFTSKAQGWKNIVGHVCFAGSALPYVPTFYGKQNQRELIFLGYDSDKELDKRYADLLKDDDVPKEVKDALRKWGAKKILTLEEAAEYGRKYFGKFIEGAFPNANIHYIYGEEDNKNFDDNVEVEFDKVFILKEEEERHRVAQRKNNNAKENLEKQRDYLGMQQNILKLARSALSFKDKTQIKERVDNLIKEKKDEINSLEYPEKFKKTLNSLKKSGDLDYKLEKLNKKLKALAQEEKVLSKKDDEITHQLSKIAMQKRAPSFFMATKRRNIDAARAEEMRARVKPEYQALLADLFQTNNFFPHGGKNVDLVLDGVTVSLHHQGSVKSVVPGKGDIKKLVKNYSKEKDVPDLVIVGHGSAGLRVVPQAKDIESISRKKQRETPEIVTFIQASTLQSEENLEKLVAKSIKNNHTKRYEEKSFASGVTLYTLNKKTKEVEVEFITSNQLLKDYHAGKRIEKLQKELKETPNKSKSNIKKKIQRLKDKLKFSPVKGLAIADTHFGSANVPGRPSNYEVFEAVEKYSRKEGTPEILILNGDIPHGALSFFGSNNQYYTVSPSEMNKKIDNIAQNKRLSPEEKIKKIRQAYDEALAGIPITSSSKQLTEVKNRLENMIESVIDKKGYVYITSGNHYNKTSNDRDEALDIANLLDKKYTNHPHMHIFSAEGDESGVGEGDLPNKKRIFCCHKPKRGTDEIIGPLNQLESSNQNADLAVFGHNHHPAVGYGGGSFILNCAGMQTWNSFVGRTGLTPGLRGVVYFQIDKRGREQMKWKFVLDPTLDQYMDGNKKIKKQDAS